MTARQIEHLPGPHLFVFGHPNHELAVYGMLQRLRPATVYLTDGGGPARLAQTRAGLASLGLLDRATFLGHDENDFYTALLAHDVAAFQAVAVALRAAIEAAAPACVFTDAVEFYNPVHDLTQPIARAALVGCPGVDCFEVPVIYETSGATPRTVAQRLPASRAGNCWRLALTAPEVAAKKQAATQVYTRLRDQFDPLFGGLSDDDLATEEACAAPPGVGFPSSEQGLRYEQRAEMLFDLGRIREIIRYREHYAPVAAALITGR